MKWFDRIKAKLKGKEVPEVKEYHLIDEEIEKLSESFVSPDEKYISSLGNGYIVNFLVNKSAKKGFSFITDKRVYFKGSCLSGTGKNLVKTNEERTVDVKNITGSGFVYRRYWKMLLTLFASVIIALAAMVALATEGAYYLDIFWYSTENIKAWEDAREILEIASEKLDEIDVVKDGDERSTEVECTFSHKNKDYLISLETYYSYYGKWNGIIEALVDAIYIDIDIDDERVVRYDNEYVRDKDDFNWLFNSHEEEELASKVIELGTEVADSEIEYWENKRDDSGLVVGQEEFNLTVLMIILSPLLLLPVVVILCIGIKKYLFIRKTLFRIEYAGGCIAFDVTYYAKAEIDEFQKQLRRAKDMAEESATVKTVAMNASVEPSVKSNTADDLRKYAELLKDGLITQEEYDAMKKKIMGL